MDQLSNLVETAVRQKRAGDDDDDADGSNGIGKRFDDDDDVVADGLNAIGKRFDDNPPVVANAIDKVVVPPMIVRTSSMAGVAVEFGSNKEKRKQGSKKTKTKTKSKSKRKKSMDDDDEDEDEDEDEEEEGEEGDGLETTGDEFMQKKRSRKRRDRELLPRLCSRCGRSGHNKATCKSETVVCRLCRVEGHAPEDCTYRQTLKVAPKSGKVAPSPKARPSSDEDRFEEALELREQGQESASRELLLELGNREFPDAMYELGYSFGLEKNWDQSLHWYRLAGNHLAEANLNMGVVLRDELNQPEAALDSFLRGARMGDVSCVLEAAQMYQVQFQYEAAVKILQGSQQNARAKMRLASFYELGRGVERSVDRALELLSEAVAVGNTEEASDARAFYGNLLVRMGRFKDAVAALEGAKNHPLALYTLGRLYLDTGGAENVTLAVSALQRGAALADAKSLRCLGKLYRDGVGVPCDADKANEYFLRAARLFEEDGESDSLFHLARMHEKGQGVLVDRVRCLELLRRAATFALDPSPEAMFLLWKLEPSKEEADGWLKLSAKHGHPKANFVRAMQALEAGNAEEARAFFAQAGNYKDAREQLRRLADGTQ